MSQKILLMFQCALGLGAIAADGVLLPVPTCNKNQAHQIRTFRIEIKVKKYIKHVID